MLTPAEWHQRYRQQAGWTEVVRQHLYQRAGIAQARRVLEVGCGTGAITADLHQYTPASVTGIDLNRDDLAYAKAVDSRSDYSAADALALPFPTGEFDAAVCHFFLLWVSRPEQALAEMARVTRYGGVVLALAEPDYGGRMDYPPELAVLGRKQAEALVRQGANTQLGRELAALLRGAGLREVEVGLLGGQWQAACLPQGWETEWKVLENDLKVDVPPGELQRLKDIDRRAWEKGERILFVPTFYGWGRNF